jgi:hypothetical protein
MPNISIDAIARGMNQDFTGAPKRITREAYAKMNLYAHMASKVAGHDIECFGTQLNLCNAHDGVTRDVKLTPGVTISSASCEGEKGALVAPRGWKNTGFWHSHGTYGVFDSETDKENYPGLF